MDQAAFLVVEMQSTFGEFGEWLIDATGPHKAALIVHRYLPFFMAMERQWKRIPSYNELLGHFGAEGLRRVRLPMRWLREAKNVESDPDAREKDSERRRIEAIVESVPRNSPGAQALISYKINLIGRVKEGKSSLRSVRLALRPTASLLLVADPRGKKLPDQASLDLYMLDAPGQRAAITGFINFLNGTYGLGLIARVDKKKVREARRRLLEKKIIRMTKCPEEGDDFEKRWIAAGLEYFHNVAVGRKKLASASVVEDDEGFRVEVDGRTFFLPSLCKHT
jgi:hypothetical protein